MDRMCVNFTTRVLRFKVRLRQVRGYGRKTKSPKTYSVMCSSTWMCLCVLNYSGLTRTQKNITMHHPLSNQGCCVWNVTWNVRFDRCVELRFFFPHTTRFTLKDSVTVFSNQILCFNSRIFFLTCIEFV